MTGTNSIGGNTETVAKRLMIYRGVLGFNMFCHIGIGLGCLFFPQWIAEIFGLPGPIPDGWTRGWGATLILVTALYVPGWRDPVGTRAPNWIGVGGRVWMGTVWVYCGGGFLWFAGFDYGFALLIGFLYWRLLHEVKKSGQ